MGPFDNVDKILQELNSRLEIISDWDRGFLESVMEQWDRKRSLSYKQIETLENIYGRYDEKPLPSTMLGKLRGMTRRKRQQKWLQNITLPIHLTFQKLQIRS